MKLEKIIKLLREGVEADIWYDADMYQDKRTAKQIAKVQKAMRAAAMALKHEQVFAEVRAKLLQKPLSAAPCDTKSQEGHDPRPFGASEEEVCAALDSLDAKHEHYDTKAYVTTAAETLIEKLRDMEDLVSAMQASQRNGGKVSFDALSRRIKWCKDDCMILRAKMKEPH